MYADVIPLLRMPTHHAGVFTYEIPDVMRFAVGSYVLVPFRKRSRWGVVRNLASTTDRTRQYRLQTIRRVLEAPTVPPEHLAVVERLSALSGCSLATVAYLSLPTPPLHARPFAANRERPARTGPARRPHGPEWVKRVVEGGHGVRVGTYQTIAQRLEVICAIAQHEMQAQRSVLIVTALRVWRERIADALRDTGIPVVVFDRAANRRTQWDAYTRSRASPVVVVGTRVAVCVPPPHLGAIVIDDAASDDQKQYDAQPKFDAREMAKWIGRTHRIPVISLSPAPRVADWASATRRFDLGQSLAAPPSIIDLDRFWRGGNFGFLTPALIDELRACVRNRCVGIVLHNRRGRMVRVRCGDCGYDFPCSTCTRTLVEHDDALRCHACSARNVLPQRCPQCASPRLSSRAPGTAGIADALAAVFPNADIARVDRDRPASPSSTASIIVGSERFLSAVAPTFGRTVGCVAILHAERFARSDTYRAQERLLGALRSGAVFARSWGAPYIVQTSDPTSPAIRALAGDLSSFYREEIRERDALGYPPATRLLRLDARSDASDAESLRAWTATLPRGTVQAVDGPYEHPEQRGRVRRSILLRLDPNISDDTIADVVQNAMEAWTVDLDPVEL